MITNVAFSKTKIRIFYNSSKILNAGYIQRDNYQVIFNFMKLRFKKFSSGKAPYFGLHGFLMCLFVALAVHQEDNHEKLEVGFHFRQEGS